MIEISPLVIRTFLESKFFVNAATAGVIIATAIILAHFFSRFVGLLILKLGWKEKLQKFGLKNPAGFIEAVTTYIIYAIAFIWALKRLGIFKVVFGIIGVIVIGLVIIAVYLEFRDAIANLVAYLFVRKLKLKPEEIIKISGVEGRIEKIGLFEITLSTEKKDVVIIPNRFFVRAKVERKGYKI